MKKVIAGITAAAGLIILICGFFIMNKTENAAVGIIGGADGPTEVFLTGAPESYFSIALIAVGAVTLAAAVIAIILLIVKKR
ncbi:MAG: oxaloacetate decarboxylase [Acutalibacteraceae bacterium]